MMATITEISILRRMEQYILIPMFMRIVYIGQVLKCAVRAEPRGVRRARAVEHQVRVRGQRVHVPHPQPPLRRAGGEAVGNEAE